MNRQGMPNANYKNWTPLEFVSELVYNWSEGNNLPKNGALVKLETVDGVTFIKDAEL